MSNDVTTAGRLLFEDSLPDEFQDAAKDLNKGKYYDLLTKIADKYPEKYKDILHKLNKVTAHAVTNYGGVSSIALKDFELSDELKQLRNVHKKKVDDINQSNLSDDVKRKQIVDYLLPEMEKVQNMIKKMDGSSNSLISQLSTGARGNPAQVMQLMYGDMMIVDANNDIIPIAGLQGYGEGVTTPQYWAATYGARKGGADVQFATADSGYYGKLLTQGVQRVTVTEDDCGTDDCGIKVNGSDKENIGTVLLRSVNGLPKGTVIGKEHLPIIDGEDIYVRSTTTCTSAEGVCAKCAGIREKGSFPEIGDSIGVTASRAIAEPVTQGSLGSKHTGGVAGIDDKKIDGFKEMAQFINVPNTFIGAAILSTTDGRISNIVKAAQGGHYVSVGSEKHYVPNDTAVSVKIGDIVTSGDMLSKGTPNPAEIVKYKGIGEGRRYFAEQYHKILTDNGAGTDKRNVEAAAKGLINRVRITDPEGYDGHFINDLVSYDDVARHYKPRKTSHILDVGRTRGQYLETPTLHYSIGTRMTPSVIKNLSDAKISSIVVNDKPPPFEPEMARVMAASETDKDWKVRLGGFNLKRSLVDAASKGSTSNTKKSTSYIPSVIAGGVGMYEGYKK